MSAQDHVERALRELHVILSQCEIYDKEKSLVIVDKKRFVDALDEHQMRRYWKQDKIQQNKMHEEKEVILFHRDKRKLL